MVGSSEECASPFVAMSTRCTMGNEVCCSIEPQVTPLTSSVCCTEDSELASRSEGCPGEFEYAPQCGTDAICCKVFIDEDTQVEDLQYRQRKHKHREAACGKASKPCKGHRRLGITAER